MSLNVALCGFYGKNNFGDDLMQDCLSEILSNKKNKVTVFSDGCSLGVENGLSNKSYLHSDLIVIGGGGIISKDFWIFKNNGFDDLINSWRPIYFLNVNVYADVLNDKIFSFKLKSLNAKWWVRDSESKNNLKKIGIESEIMPDVIFYKTDSIITKEVKKKLIFFPNYYSFSRGLEGTSLESWILLQRNITTFANYFNWLISFGWKITISFTQHGLIDDRTIGGMIYAQIKDKSKVNWDLKIVNWEDKIKFITEHDFVVSMRYHTSLAAVMNGIPCIDVVHHDKNKYFWKDLQFNNKTLNIYTIDNQQLCEMTDFSNDFSCYLSKINDYRILANNKWKEFEHTFNLI